MQKNVQSNAKYKNIKTTVNGITFDSKKEANRYVELLLLQRANVISNLELQKKYVLIPSQYEGKKCIEKECYYKADFVYEENGKTVVEDVKGHKTKEYKIKRKLMLFNYGIKIKEV